MTTASEARDDRKYTRDHEWAMEEDGEILVGITAFAVDQLGDITLVNIDAQVGDSVDEGTAFGTIESVKTLSDLFAPISGEITRVNEALEDKPELINEDCWGEGWMIAIKPSGEDGDLLDAPRYRKLLEETDH